MKANKLTHGPAEFHQATRPNAVFLQLYHSIASLVASIPMEYERHCHSNPPATTEPCIPHHFH